MGVSGVRAVVWVVLVAIVAACVVFAQPVREWWHARATEGRPRSLVEEPLTAAGLDYRWTDRYATTNCDVDGTANPYQWILTGAITVDGATPERVAEVIGKRWAVAEPGNPDYRLQESRASDIGWTGGIGTHEGRTTITLWRNLDVRHHQPDAAWRHTCELPDLTR